MADARLIYNGDGVYTDKEKRVNKLTQEIEEKINNIPGVIDNINSTSTTDALSANMGKALQDQINAITGLNKYLSSWDCTTGLPVTDPVDSPHTYATGDYYIVATVAPTGQLNYRPHGSVYTPGVASQTVETEEVNVNDFYIYDGNQWLLQVNKVKEIIIDDGLSPTSRNAVENRAVYLALTTKQDNILDLSTIRAGAALGATSIQPGDNITELTNNIGYQTAGEVASAINDAIEGSKYVGPTAPSPATEGMLWYDTTNDLLKVYNGTSWDIIDTDTTYTAGYGLNLSSGEFSVDTTVIANKQYVDDSIGDTISSGSAAPQNPTEGQLWYDTTNHILKIYNGTSWTPVDTYTNVKAFYIKSASQADATDLAQAQAAYDYWKAGNNPIIVFGTDETTNFHLTSDSHLNGDKLSFYEAYTGYSVMSADGDTQIHNTRLDLNYSSDVVTSITYENQKLVKFLSTDVNYSAYGPTYTPAYDGSPTTKKYVDDKVKNAITSGTTAPSNPVTGQLWYDTTNNILKVWDGDSWEIVGDGDMKYNDFNFQNKSGATVTLDLSTSITPSANFTINAPSSIKDGQRYILRVTNGAIVYTMTLGTNITNPYNEDLTLTENGIDQFVFLAVGGNLELQPGDPEATSYNAGKGIIIGDDYSAMQGPCDDGFHIPSKDEWVTLYDMGVSLGAWNSNGGSDFKTYLKIPFAGSRWYEDSHEFNQEHVGYYWSSTHAGEEFAYNIEFGDIVNPTQFSRRSDANSIRPFKDISISPNSNWTVLYQGSGNSGIYHSPSLGIISISSDGNNWITIADKNLGATTVYNNGNTLSEANCGKYYQRGNNYGFPRTGTVTTSSTQVDASSYGPGNYYDNSTFIIRTTSPSGWDSSNNNNLWGEITGIVSDAISVDTSIIKNISVSGASMGAFAKACKEYGTVHTTNFSGPTTYTFRGLGFVKVGSMHGYALSLNDVEMFNYYFTSGTYHDEYFLGPYTASAGDVLKVWIPGSQGSIGGTIYDYY